MTKLNLGCGKDYREGWVNLDIGDKNNLGEKIRVDGTHNLNEFPYPFRDNHFDEILMNQVLEHLDNPEKVMKEVVRICKGTITIRVPHFSDVGAYEEPTHKHYFSINSIDKISYGLKVEKSFEYSHNFILGFIGRMLTISPFVYERFFHGYFPIQGIKWVLTK